MGLYCDKKMIREAGKSLCLLVNSITCFFFLNLSDFIGRKKVILINSVMVTLSMLMSYFATNFYLKMGFIGFAYGCEGCFSSLFLFMMNEVTRNLSLIQILTPN